MSWITSSYLPQGTLTPYDVALHAIMNPFRGTLNLHELPKEHLVLHGKLEDLADPSRCTYEPHF